MPNGTIPDFEWRGFLDATLAFLTTSPLALALVVTAAFIVLCELCFAYAKESARIRTAEREAARKQSQRTAQAQLLDAIARARRG